MRIGYVFLVCAALLCTGEAFAQRRGGLQQFDNSSSSSLSDSDKASMRRRAAGVGDMKVYGGDMKTPEKPVPWLGIGLALLVMLGLTPVGWTYYKSTRKDLEDQATFGLKGNANEREAAAKEAAAAGPKAPVESLAGLSTRPASRRPGARKAVPQEAGNETRMLTVDQLKAEKEAAAEASARDRVWDAISTASNWVTADWVANNAGLTADEASDELGALVEEGYLQQNKDNKGRQVFRSAS